MKSHFFGQNVKTNALILKIDWHSTLDYLMIVVSVCALMIYA
jgi:hypothetical protein